MSNRQSFHKIVTTVAAFLLAVLSSAAAAGAPLTFTQTGSMDFPRVLGTVTRLLDGTVLITGGIVQDGVDGTFLNSGTIYNPASGLFSPTGSMTTGRNGATATLFPDGTVLIAGGSYVDANGVSHLLASAEVYNPATTSFTAVGSMHAARAHHTATLLGGGVLIAGGDGINGVLGTAEWYDPSSKTFRTVGPLTVPRTGHTATMLHDGTVLLTGGSNGATAVASAEIYSLGGFGITSSATGSMTAARTQHTATILPDGRVLVVGGTDAGGNTLASGETYSPSTKTFAPVGSLSTGRSAHAAAPSGSVVVIVCGSDAGGTPLNSAEVFDSTTNTFSDGGTMTAARVNPLAVGLGPGVVFVAGGTNQTGPLITAELG